MPVYEILVLGVCPEKGILPIGIEAKFSFWVEYVLFETCKSVFAGNVEN